jgi:Beta-ketoacyl synthase, N-terminal domain
MLSASVQGLAFWSPAWGHWAQAAPALRGDGAPPQAQGGDLRRPSPRLLGANERRRAPDSVLMALQVAEDACAAAGVDPAGLPSVFTSAHGDLAIVDALCRTLAGDPLLLSPMRFHHSVHNAASGYWAIGCRSHQASTAVAGGRHSFAAGLLEALTQCASEQRPVLLVGCDTEAMGPLQSVNHSRGLLAVALLLAPGGARRLSWSLQAGPTALPALRSAAARSLRHNAMSDALPLFEALADSGSTSLALPLSATLALALQLDPA